MSLKLIMGPSGSGKTYIMNKSIIEEAKKRPELNYIVIVPEQFTMETQKSLIRMSETSGLMNVDIVSFNRFAFRVFEELGINILTILDDTGKSLVLRKVVEDVKDELTVFGDKIRMQGFIDEIKSSISEILQYAVDDKKFEEMIKKSEKRPVLTAKLRDISTIYRKFREFDYKYITKEEVLKVLSREVYRSAMIKNSVIFFDGFTGFTPIQYMLIEQLAALSRRLTFTVTLPYKEACRMGSFGYNNVKEHDLFRLSKETVNNLYDICVRVRTKMEMPVVMGSNEVYRLKDTKMLSYLERSMASREKLYSGDIYPGEYNDEITVLACTDKRTETFYTVSYIADTIRKKCMRYRDFAIVTADDAYGEYLREAFEIYDVPYFMDNRRSIIANPFVMAIRGALEILIKNYSYESVMSYLRTYMTDLSINDIDLMDNYIFAFGIKGAKAYKNEWTSSDRDMSEEELQHLNDIRRQFIEPLDRLGQVFSERKKNIYGMTRALYDFIVYFDMENKLEQHLTNFESRGESALCLEYRQIYKSVMDMFDKLINIAGETGASTKEYKDILEAGFNEIKIKIIPPTLDGVVVGDIKRTRLSDVKYLFFLGVNDGVIPSVQNGSNLLSGRDREFLKENGIELSPTAKENIFIQQFYLYLYLTKPSERLILLYSKSSENGSVLAPSYLIGEIKNIFPEIKEKQISENDIIIVTKQSGTGYVAKNMRKIKEDGRCDDDFPQIYGYFMRDEQYKNIIKKLADAAFYKNKSDRLSRIVAEAVYGDGFINSITRLEKYAACSFAHFMEYGLNLAPRKEYRITMMDIGTIYHGIIEEYFKKAAVLGLKIREIDDETSEKLLDETVEKVCARYEQTGLFLTARNAYMINRIRRVSKKTVKILTKHIKEGSFEPKYYELTFGNNGVLDAMNYTLTDGRLMKLTGKIDRVDIMENKDGSEVVKIIDYKSGKKSFSMEEVKAGLQIQMLVYMNAFIEMEKREGREAYPGAILYFKVDDPITDVDDSRISDEELEEIAGKNYKMNGLINSESSVVEALDNNISKTSGIVGIKKTKDGGYAPEAGNMAVSRDEFDKIMSDVRAGIQSMGDEIVKGNNDINPYRMKDETACTYCEYKDICSFDARYDAGMYREI